MNAHDLDQPAWGGPEADKTPVGRSRASEARRPTLPNFLIIGAMKGGTTSLYHYLKEHPEVFMPETKELHYFVAEKNFRRGVEWYQRQFAKAGDVAAIGEASPDYAKYPIHQGIPERIARLLPEARLIYVIRHPLERIRSHYLHDVACGRERRPIGDAVPGNEHFLAPTRYALQIDQYLDHFSRDQLLVVTSEQLRHDRDRTMRRVHRFIGVADDCSTSMQDVEYNATRDKTTPGILLRLGRHLPGGARLRLLLPRQVKAAERTLGGTKRPVDTQAAAMSAQLEREIVGELTSDLEHLRELMPPDFDAWGLV